MSGLQLWQRWLPTPRDTDRTVRPMGLAEGLARLRVAGEQHNGPAAARVISQLMADPDGAWLTRIWFATALATAAAEVVDGE